MKKENIFKTKKKYTAPKMDVSVLKHETNLLQCSLPGECEEPPECTECTAN